MAGAAPSPGSSRKSPDGQIPSASSGEIRLKRLPSPAPDGLKVSKLAKSIIRPISGAAAIATAASATAVAGAARRASAIASAAEPRAAASAELDHSPQPGSARQPQQPGEAVGVDGADRQRRQRYRGERVASPGSAARARGQPSPRQLVQADRERKHEECLHGLLEGALDQVRGGHVGKAHKKRTDDPPPLRERRHKRKRRQRRRHRDRQHQPVEAVDEAGAGALRCGDDQGMGTERVALTEEPAALAVSELVGGVEMLRHVRIEAGAEDPEAPLDEERKRCGEQRQPRHGQADAAPSRRESPTRPIRKAREASVRAPIAIADAAPSPGRRTVPHATAVSTESPTAGASQDH